MSTYSIAQAKDQFSRLVDEAIRGEQVTITRHGKPVVEMKPAANQPKAKRTTAEMLEELRQFRETLPQLELDSAAIIREMRDEF